jgi:hypothetical protein
MVAVAVAMVAWALYVAWPRNMKWVHSELTGKKYHVKNAEGAEAVADRLAFMELRIRDFLKRAESYAPGDHRLANIAKRWNGTLSETPNNEDVAYSISKDSISVCVKRPDGSMEPENTTMFVLIHELAHIGTDRYGHTSEFWSNMRFLLELAEATGSYSYQDFDSQIISYCGRKLAASPLTCVKKGACNSELRAARGRSKKIPG